MLQAPCLGVHSETWLTGTQVHCSRKKEEGTWLKEPRFLETPSMKQHTPLLPTHLWRRQCRGVMSSAAVGRAIALVSGRKAGDVMKTSRPAWGPSRMQNR